MGTLRLLPRSRADGTPAKPRPATAFSLYVKSNFAATKRELAGRPHGDVMRALGERFKALRVDDPSGELTGAAA